MPIAGQLRPSFKGILSPKPMPLMPLTCPKPPRPGALISLLVTPASCESAQSWPVYCSLVRQSK
jgi:hypothetical protein